MKVLNKRTDKINSDAVYVGRPSKWGNPFVVGKHGNRIEVIKFYRQWLTPEMKEAARQELKGKDLVCWCAPLPCHADVLIEIANG